MIIHLAQGLIDGEEEMIKKEDFDGPTAKKKEMEKRSFMGPERRRGGWRPQQRRQRGGGMDPSAKGEQIG